MAPLTLSDRRPFLTSILVLLQAVALHIVFLYLDTPPPRHSSFLLAQASLEPNLYLYKHRSNLSHSNSTP